MVASSECRYKKPLYFPGDIIVKAQIDWVKNTSFQISYRMFNRSGELTAEGEDVIVVFDHRPDDPRITRVGKFLRRTSLDELPNLLNVIRGHMSLVGPRPPTPDEVELYEPWHMQRLQIMPGITGLWQISGRSDVPFEEMCLLDIYYIENWSLKLDIQILMMTLPRVLLRHGAY
jgi:lipopolysaccharide/colanic/teichoic acid biosynthesis glycosyltransferase